MSTLTTYTAAYLGHTIDAIVIDGVWEAQIDSATPLMERDWDLRSTYASPELEIVVRVAKCVIYDYVSENS